MWIIENIYMYNGFKYKLFFFVKKSFIVLLLCFLEGVNNWLCVYNDLFK